MGATNQQSALKGKERPKNRLRREREMRGWSRDYVAEKVGSDPRTVGRWERGTTSPSPYYRQALCELFRMNADELDLLKENGQEKEGGEQPPVEKEQPLGEGREAEPPIEPTPVTPKPSLPPKSENPTCLSPSSASLAAPSTYPVAASQISVRSIAGVTILSIVVFMLCTILFSLFAWRVLPSMLFFMPGQIANTSPGIKPGGLWVYPINGQTVHGILNFAAKAYPTNPGDPTINRVNFTVDWKGKGGGWRIACTAFPPVTDNLFTCTAILAAFNAPPGTIQLSFDVYDQAGHINFAPNGIYKVMYVP